MQEQPTRKKSWLNFGFIEKPFRRVLTDYPKLGNILGNIAWLSGGKVVELIISLVVSVWVARYLGPSDFGKLNFSLAFVVLFSPLQSLAHNKLIVKYIVKEPSYKNEILGTSLIIKFTMGVLLLIFSFIILIFLMDETSKTIIWLVALFAASRIFSYHEMIDAWFEAEVQSKYSVLSSNISLFSVSLFKIIGILSGASVIYFAIVDVVRNSLRAIFSHYFYAKKSDFFSLRFDWKWCKKVIKESFPIFLSGIMVIIYVKIDQVMLGELSSKKEVGTYAAAAKISEVFYFIPTVIAASFFPLLLKTNNTKSVDFKKRMQSLYDINTGLALLISVIISFLAPFIIIFLYGEAYEGAIVILLIHVWASVFVFLGVVREHYLICAGYLRYSFYFTTIGAVSNILLNLILIPKYGGIGAAIATLISYAISGFFTSFMIHKVRKTAFMQVKSFSILFRFPKLYKEVRNFQSQS